MVGVVGVAVMMMVVVNTNSVEIKRIPVVSVTGVERGTAALPCEVSHPLDDSIYLLLWFRDPITTPIYRLDERRPDRDEGGRQWSNDQLLGSRARLEVGSSPALLRLTSLTQADQGLYTCRVDFRLQPTKTTRVNLTVVVPPDGVTVLLGTWDAPQGTAGSVVGPYLEGDTLQLTCVAHGDLRWNSVLHVQQRRNVIQIPVFLPQCGTPPPSVVWYQNTHLLDTDMESRSLENTTITFPALKVTTLGPGPAGRQEDEEEEEEPTVGEPFNTLTLGPLNRSHLQILLTCEASNNNLTIPTSFVVTVDMNLPPLDVEIRPPVKEPLTAGRQYHLQCVVVGARPTPTISWWTGHQRVLEAEVTTSGEGNVTTSTIELTPRPQDHGSVIRCEAETQVPPAALEDSRNLTVYYLPKASCSFGSSLDSTNIKEGDDVYFECSIEANPRATRVSWRHNELLLTHNVSGGVIVSNQSLVLQRVARAQTGRYSCLATNLVGRASSNALRLDIKYAPVCSPGQVTTYAVSRYEDAEVTCSVDANPVQDSFQWTFNNTADTIDVPQGRFSSTRSHSVITYTPMTSLDYGTLLCWATNEIGTQREPCVFHIVPAGKPGSPGDCRVRHGSRTSVRVRCEAGNSGGLTQHFLLEADLQHGPQNGLQALNFTAPSVPDFYVEGLEEGQTYQLVVRAVNDKGTSEATILTITSAGTNGSVYQLYDGPSEAEVRDSGKKMEEGNEGSQHVDESLLESLTLPSVVAGVLSAGSGLVFLLILLLLVITFRSRRAPQAVSLAAEHHHKDVQEERRPQCGSGGESRTSSLLTSEHDSSCLERDMQVEYESDLDPDVIPLQESSGGGKTPLAVTLLPSEGYRYPSVHLPTFVSAQGNPRYSILGVVPQAPPAAPPRGVKDAPGPYYPHDHHRDRTYHQELPKTSSLPRRTPVTSPTAPGSYPAVLSPDQLPYQEVEGSLPNPVASYPGLHRKQVSFTRHLSYEDDAPSTPLLKKAESCV